MKITGNEVCELTDMYEGESGLMVERSERLEGLNRGNLSSQGLTQAALPHPMPRPLRDSNTSVSAACFHVISLEYHNNGGLHVKISG